MGQCRAQGSPNQAPWGRSRRSPIILISFSDGHFADPPTDAAVDLAEPVSPEDHVLGPDDAPITLVEYGDYECPDCVASFPDVSQLLEESAGRLQFVFRHFSRTSIHPRASVAAQAAEAAGAQGKFWEMHRELFLRQGGLEPDDLDRLALRLNLEVYRFHSDLTSRRWSRRVERDADSARRSGVTSTPTFFINGRRLSGSKMDDLRAAALTG